MKKTGLKKKGLLKILTVMLIMSMMVPMVFAATLNIRVVVNGKQVNFPDAKPYMDANNRVLIPVRFVSEELGAKVEWEAKNKVVTITDSKNTVILKVGEKEITVNGTSKTLDTAAIMEQARTYVPIRFVSEALGAAVEWDQNSKTVYINNDGKTPVKSEVISIGSFRYALQEGDNYVIGQYSAPYIDTVNKASIIIITDPNNTVEMVLQAAWGMVDGDFYKQCDEIEALLSQQISKNKLKEIMKYVRSKTSNNVELPKKEFIDEKYRVRIISDCNSTVDIYVDKR